MSNNSTRRAPSAASGRSSGAQDSSASSASSRVEMTSKDSPVSARMRCRKAGALLARRQASVAMARTAVTRRRVSRSAQPRSATIARAMASSPRLPLSSPSPSRTMREKRSSTRKPWPVGSPTSSRQLLVPRSSAA